MVKSYRVIFIICLFSFFWALILALDVVPQIRGDFGWRWPYAVLTDLTRLVPLVLALTVYLIVGWRWRERGRIRLLQLWAVLGTIVLTVAALFITNDPFYELYTVTLAGETGGWHYMAAHIEDLGESLRQWPSVMKESVGISSHIGISPPGMVVAYYAANELAAEAPALVNYLGPPLRAAQCSNAEVNNYRNAEFVTTWFGILMPFWAGLTVFPLFRFGRYLFGEAVARWSIFWWPLLPGLLMFSPSPSTAFPLFSVIVVGTLLKGLAQNKPLWVWAAGLMMSVLTFMTFSFMPLILLAGLLALGLYLYRNRLREAEALQRISWRWPWFMGLGYGLGLVFVWLIYYIVSGVTIWDIFGAATSYHLELDRPYWPWLFLHPYDFFIFTGWPLTLLAGLGVWNAWRRWRKSELLTMGDLFVLLAVLTFLILIVSGTLRGETGRILLYLSPFLILLAAQAMVNSAVSSTNRAGLWLTLTQAAMIVIMAAFLRVGGSAFNFQPPLGPAPPAQLPPAPVPNGATFAKVLHLKSFAGQVEEIVDQNGKNQPVLTLWLQWESSGQVEIPYWLGLIPVAPNGDAALAATLVRPYEGAFPATCWLPRSGSFWQQVHVPLFQDDFSGDWWVSLSLIDVETGQKAAVVAPDGSPDDQVGLGPFQSPRFDFDEEAMVIGVATMVEAEAGYVLMME